MEQKEYWGQNEKGKKTRRRLNERKKGGAKMGNGACACVRE